MEHCDGQVEPSRDEWRVLSAEELEHLVTRTWAEAQCHTNMATHEPHHDRRSELLGSVVGLWIAARVPTETIRTGGGDGPRNYRTKGGQARWRERW